MYLYIINKKKQTHKLILWNDILFIYKNYYFYLFIRSYKKKNIFFILVYYGFKFHHRTLKKNETVSLSKIKKNQNI